MVLMCCYLLLSISFVNHNKVWLLVLFSLCVCLVVGFLGVLFVCGYFQNLFLYFL